MRGWGKVDEGGAEGDRWRGGPQLSDPASQSPKPSVIPHLTEGSAQLQSESQSSFKNREGQIDPKFISRSNEFKELSRFNTASQRENRAGEPTAWLHDFMDPVVRTLALAPWCTLHTR